MGDIASLRVLEGLERTARNWRKLEYRKIVDENALRDWLNGKETAYACVLAARTALRVLPILEFALREDEEEKRRLVILPSFRALAAVNFSGTFLGRVVEVRNVARLAGQEVQTAMDKLFNDASMNVVHVREALPDIHEEVLRYERDTHDLRVAGIAADAVIEATQSVVAKVDVERGIDRSSILLDVVVSIAQIAQTAIDGIHEDTEFFIDIDENDSSSEVPRHIKQFWGAVALDVELLKAGAKTTREPEEVVAELSEKALWLDGIPEWASRRWADFKDRLPEVEGWGVWISWYEARLKGQKLDAQLETDVLNIAIEDWRQGPAHVNSIIAELVQSRFDPQKVAIVCVFEEDLEQVKQVSSINLKRHSDRIRNALPKDPQLAIGATKEMLEATMKTILHSRGKYDESSRPSFPELMTLCFRELRLSGDSPPATDSERHVRKFANRANQMIETVNECRNFAGTGHGWVVGKEPAVTAADATLVALTGLNLAAWLLRRAEDG